MATARGSKIGGSSFGGSTRIRKLAAGSERLRTTLEAPKDARSRAAARWATDRASRRLKGNSPEAASTAAASSSPNLSGDIVCAALDEERVQRKAAFALVQHEVARGAAGHVQRDALAFECIAG